MSSWGAPPSTASSEASQQQAQEPSWHQQNGLGQLDLSPPRSPRARRPPPLTGSLGSVAAAAASEAAQPLPDVPEDGGLEEGDGGVERGGAEQEEESQTTFGGSWQEDAPAPFDFVPPISRAPSEWPGRVVTAITRSLAWWIYFPLSLAPLRAPGRPARPQAACTACTSVTCSPTRSGSSPACA